MTSNASSRNGIGAAAIQLEYSPKRIFDLADGLYFVALLGGQNLAALSNPVAPIGVSLSVSLQFLRYAIVGIVSNTIAYVIYLVLAYVGLAPILAMSMVYVLGVLQTFVFNRRWTFGHRGDHKPAFFRYCLVYCLGYAVNLVALVVFVNSLGYPHEVVQGVMILLLAVMLFLFQKIWVFR